MAPSLRKRIVPSAARTHRRGVASVLAMMFLIVFGSLVAAMAITSTGNIRTASMHLHVMQAMGAAETGMMIAQDRLDEAAGRFVVAESDIDAARTTALWDGDAGGIGVYTVRPAPSGFSEPALPTGVAEALVNHHDADQNVVTAAGFITAAQIGTAPAGVDGAVYRDAGWVYTPAVMVETPAAGPNPAPAFQIRYAPLADGEHIRVIVDGYSFDVNRGGEPVSRTIMRDFRLNKSVDHAIISHARILIGKNVVVDGDLGARFTDTEYTAGDPINLVSDFYGIDPILDQKLERFWAATQLSDVDGDNRLRIGHPIEGLNLPADDDFDGDGDVDGAFQDVTGDGFLDEFDIFIRHYDADGDGRVVVPEPWLAGTTAADDGATPEFVNSDGTPADLDLALLLDSLHPDRNRNGVYGFEDDDNDGIFDPADGERLLDFDDVTNTFPDQVLGYRDGYIDAMDQYAKVAGRLMFTAEASAWELNQGPIQPKLRGPIIPDDEDGAPLTFGLTDQDLPNITAGSFVDTENALMAGADGDPFWTQVAAQLGATLPDLPTWTEAMNPAGTDTPYLVPLWSDADLDGLPDNWDVAYFEEAPFNSPVISDFYYRPVFRNMVFRDVEIPIGLNGLFEDCTFVGVTWVRLHTDNSHPHWSQYGVNYLGPSGRPIPKFPRYIYGDDPGEDPADAPPTLPATAIPPAQLLEMTDPSTSPLDKGDVLASEIVSYGSAYTLLPDALVVGGRRYVDTKMLSNNLRFHNCLFVGSIVADTPVTYTQVRNKVQFTGETRFTTVHPDEPANGFLNPDPADLDDILRSSMMLPNYSVDIGTFNSPPEQNVRLQGAVIAGVLDARGNTTIDGALLLTYRPERGVQPLADVFGEAIGNPAGFNASLGYFGESNGDFESIDPSDLPLIGGVRIAGWDLDGDGLIDVPVTEPQPPGSTAVPFHGYGRILLRHDPDMELPGGLLLPLKAPPVRGTYREGSL